MSEKWVVIQTYHRIGLPGFFQLPFGLSLYLYDYDSLKARTQDYKLCHLCV